MWVCGCVYLSRLVELSLGYFCGFWASPTREAECFEWSGCGDFRFVYLHFVTALSHRARTSFLFSTALEASSCPSIRRATAEWLCFIQMSKVAPTIGNLTMFKCGSVATTRTFWRSTGGRGRMTMRNFEWLANFCTWKHLWPFCITPQTIDWAR